MFIRPSAAFHSAAVGLSPSGFATRPRRLDPEARRRRPRSASRPRTSAASSRPSHALVLHAGSALSPRHYDAADLFQREPARLRRGDPILARPLASVGASGSRCAPAFNLVDDIVEREPFSSSRSRSTSQPESGARAPVRPFGGVLQARRSLSSQTSSRSRASSASAGSWRGDAARPRDAVGLRSARRPWPISVLPRPSSPGPRDQRPPASPRGGLPRGGGGEYALAAPATGGFRSAGAARRAVARRARRRRARAAQPASGGFDVARRVRDTGRATSVLRGSPVAARFELSGTLVAAVPLAMPFRSSEERASPPRQVRAFDAPLLRRCSPRRRSSSTCTSRRRRGVVGRRAASSCSASSSSAPRAA
jgi:hypothetical protein